MFSKQKSLAHGPIRKLKKIIKNVMRFMLFLLICLTRNSKDIEINFFIEIDALLMCVIQIPHS